MLSLSEVRRAARHHNVIPLWREIAADLLTPVGALLALRRSGVGAFLLESVTGGENVARYSFLGAAPRETIRSRSGRAWIVDRLGGRRPLAGPALEAIARHLGGFRPLSVPGLPRFSGGAVGHVSYDVARLTERLPASARDAHPTDDVALMVYDDVVAFDHAAQRLVIVANVRPEGDVAGAYEAARRRLDDTTAALLEPPRAASLPPATQAPTSFRCEQPDAAFLRSVTRVKEHIRKGDAFQVVLSRRFARAVREDPVLSYRMLRRLNPSPYMYYLSLGEAGDGTVVAGTSPEMLARVKDGTIETHPIAGTRPRGADEEEDRRREAELRADPKEIAEHVMLVDLGRNDLGKVAVPGTVSVTDLMGVERYSHVMHLVSRVRATLRPGTSPLAALMACFPAGTVTGAPKVRAMEIIERLEGVRRGIYGGAVTYFDFHGNLDSCIAIRTLVFHRGLALAQAGAGIVADSDPGRELQETRHKAGVLFQAVDSVERPVATRQKESA